MDKAIFYGYYYLDYALVIFALFTLGDLFRSLQLKVTVGMDLVLVSLFAGFLYWYCQIALETLQKKLLAQYTS